MATYMTMNAINDGFDVAAFRGTCRNGYQEGGSHRRQSVEERWARRHQKKIIQDDINRKNCVFRLRLLALGCWAEMELHCRLHFGRSPIGCFHQAQYDNMEIKTVVPRLDWQGRAIDLRIGLCGDPCSSAPYCQRSRRESDSVIGSRAPIQSGNNSQLTAANSTTLIYDYSAPLSIKGSGAS